MGRQYFADTRGQDATSVDYSQVTGTTEAALWNMTGASPVPPTLFAANEVKPGQMWIIKAHGVTTTPASAATTLTMTPRWGTSTGGTSLGASAASATVTANKTNAPWFLDGTLSIRQVGASIGKAVFSSRFTCEQILAASCVTGSTAEVTIDTTVASGLWMGVTLGGSASWTIKTLGLSFYSLN